MRNPRNPVGTQSEKPPNPPPQLERTQRTHSGEPLFSKGNSLDCSPPSLNGDADAVWRVIDEHPHLLPVQLANKIQDAVNRTFTGAQIKALIAQGRPESADEEELGF